MSPSIPLDAVIFGGGAAGLWLLHQLRRLGFSAILLEAHALGQGQTVASQGIIHGGLKYTLRGRLTRSAQAVRDMPDLWRRCLRGEQEPDLSATRLRADFCHLWRTASLRSRLGLVGARHGLQTVPRPLEKSDWPRVLRDVPGEVFRIDEPVLAPDSFIAALAQPHREVIFRFDPSRIVFELASPGRVTSIGLVDHGRTLTLRPTRLVLTAGLGNAMLRQRLALPDHAMQRRPVQLAMARGALPVLNGHCVDAAHTRITVTTDRDRAGLTVWQVGGQVSEDGVNMTRDDLVRHAIAEVRATLPGVDLRGTEWSSYTVERAEPRMPRGRRPDEAFAQLEGNVVTAWPIKLALAPLLAQRVAAMLDEPRHRIDPAALCDWPRPDIAAPPWENHTAWTAVR